MQMAMDRDDETRDRGNSSPDYALRAPSGLRKLMTAGRHIEPRSPGEAKRIPGMQSVPVPRLRAARFTRATGSGFQGSLMRHLAVLVLTTLPLVAPAQDAHLLQQRASFAYREMQQAERDAERTEAETQNLETNAAQLRKQLQQYDQQIAASRKQAADARARAAEARSRWTAESEALEKVQGRPAAKP
ncbi:MAG: hypothetical protein IT204_26410 [Fimbriimonadaceae bacterium]|nr:hypothetical protein [Fimbriimonadaceae bacterium]